MRGNTQSASDMLIGAFVNTAQVIYRECKVDVI